MIEFAVIAIGLCVGAALAVFVVDTSRQLRTDP